MWTVTWKGESTMNMDSATRSKLLKQIKRGRLTGAVQWVRLFVIVGATVEMFRVNEAVRQGKGNFALLTAAIGMVFLVAVAAIGLGQLEMNERFAVLLDLIGEDK
jgi:uncharacterized oligopeptide transporter (OPT) family protein